MAATKPIIATDITDIQRRMAQIRHDMHQEVQGVVKGAQSLTDWRSLVKRHPWPSLALASAVGYLIVPKRRIEPATIVALGSPNPERLARSANEDVADKPRRARSNAFGVILGLAAPIVVRAAQNYALNHLEAWLAQHPLPSGGSGPRERISQTENEPAAHGAASRLSKYR
jgi:hypothetical protein